MTEQVQERTDELTTREPMIERDGGKALSTADLAAASQKPRSTGHQLAPADGRATPLFSQGEAEEFRSRWSQIQTGFVDEPRNAVQQADELVARCIKRLAEVFADERTKMEHEWDRGDNVSTEDLRLALRRYRSFFDRLLSV
jgi:hypothetical protein